MKIHIQRNARGIKKYIKKTRSHLKNENNNGNASHALPVHLLSNNNILNDIVKKKTLNTWHKAPFFILLHFNDVKLDWLTK